MKMVLMGPSPIRFAMLKIMLNLRAHQRNLRESLANGLFLSTSTAKLHSMTTETLIPSEMEESAAFAGGHLTIMSSAFPAVCTH